MIVEYIVTALVLLFIFYVTVISSLLTGALAVGIYIHLKAYFKIIYNTDGFGIIYSTPRLSEATKHFFIQSIGLFILVPITSTIAFFCWGYWFFFIKSLLK